MFDTIILLAGAAEQVAMPPVLRGHNPLLTVISVGTSADLAALNADLLRTSPPPGCLTQIGPYTKMAKGRKPRTYHSLFVVRSSMLRAQLSAVGGKPPDMISPVTGLQDVPSSFAPTVTTQSSEGISTMMPMLPA